MEWVGYRSRKNAAEPQEEKEMGKKYSTAYVPMERNLREASAEALINESKRLGIIN